VQTEELAIARFLIAEHGLKAIYSEGLSERTLPDLQLRLDLLTKMDQLAELGGLDPVARAHWRELTLEVGIPGRLLHLKEIAKVLPLEDEAALARARPTSGPEGVRFDAAKLKARREAMAGRLPTSGLVLIVLGGSHDLTPTLGAGVLYVRVTCRPCVSSIVPPGSRTCEPFSFRHGVTPCPEEGR
jgi:hypothetical protein